jgi:hypothetical protein
MKYVLPLLLIAFSGFAAEPPVVKSKAAKELLKHPEFKKAMEAAPEFTKAVLKELDKHAPKPDKKPTLDGVVRWQELNGTKLPQWDELNLPSSRALGESLAKFYDGWTLDKWKSIFGPLSFESMSDGTFRCYSGLNQHEFLWNKFEENSDGRVTYFFDKTTLKVVKVGGNWGPLTSIKFIAETTTPYGKSLGYK